MPALWSADTFTSAKVVWAISSRTIKPEARIAKGKDGTTRLAYKAEHVVDRDSAFVLAARILPANSGDAETMVDNVMKAPLNLDAATAASVVGIWRNTEPPRNPRGGV